MIVNYKFLYKKDDKLYYQVNNKIELFDKDKDSLSKVPFLTFIDSNLLMSFRPDSIIFIDENKEQTLLKKFCVNNIVTEEKNKQNFIIHNHILNTKIRPVTTLTAVECVPRQQVIQSAAKTGKELKNLFGNLYTKQDKFPIFVKEEKANIRPDTSYHIENLKPVKEKTIINSKCNNYEGDDIQFGSTYTTPIKKKVIISSEHRKPIHLKNLSVTHLRFKAINKKLIFNNFYFKKDEENLKMLSDLLKPTKRKIKNNTLYSYKEEAPKDTTVKFGETEIQEVTKEQKPLKMKNWYQVQDRKVDIEFTQDYTQHAKYALRLNNKFYTFVESTGKIIEIRPDEISEKGISHTSKISSNQIADFFGGQLYNKEIGIEFEDIKQDNHPNIEVHFNKDLKAKIIKAELLPSVIHDEPAYLIADIENFKGKKYNYTISHDRDYSFLKESTSSTNFTGVYTVTNQVDFNTIFRLIPWNGDSAEEGTFFFIGEYYNHRYNHNGATSFNFYGFNLEENNKNSSGRYTYHINSDLIEKEKDIIDNSNWSDDFALAIHFLSDYIIVQSSHFSRIYERKNKSIPFSTIISSGRVGFSGGMYLGAVFDRPTSLKTLYNMIHEDKIYLGYNGIRQLYMYKNSNVEYFTKQVYYDDYQNRRATASGTEKKSHYFTWVRSIDTDIFNKKIIKEVKGYANNKIIEPIPPQLYKYKVDSIENNIRIEWRSLAKSLGPPYDDFNKQWATKDENPIIYTDFGKPFFPHFFYFNKIAINDIEAMTHFTICHSDNNIIWTESTKQTIKDVNKVINPLAGEHRYWGIRIYNKNGQYYGLKNLSVGQLSTFKNNIYLTINNDFGEDSWEGTLWYGNKIPSLTASVSPYEIKGVIKDRDYDEITWSLLVNDKEVAHSDGFVEVPCNFSYIWNDEDIKPNEKNSVTVKVTDKPGANYSDTFTFTGRRNGLYFEDEQGNIYSTNTGKAEQVLDFGTIMAGQFTERRKIAIVNYANRAIKNIKINSNKYIKFSDTEFPFKDIPYHKIPYLAPDKKEWFYIRADIPFDEQAHIDNIIIIGEGELVTEQGGE